MKMAMGLKEYMAKNTMPEPMSGCHIWIGVRSNRGYGFARVGSRTDGTRKLRSAHRVSYEMNVGEIPHGLFCLHKCDTPSCINPSHLFLGDHQANMDDMARKGRRVRGAQFPNSRLSEEDVRAIRASADPRREIARRFCVSRTTVRLIQIRRKWAHVE